MAFLTLTPCGHFGKCHAQTRRGGRGGNRVSWGTGRLQVSAPRPPSRALDGVRLVGDPWHRCPPGAGSAQPALVFPGPLVGPCPHLGSGWYQEPLHKFTNGKNSVSTIFAFGEGIEGKNIIHLAKPTREQLSSPRAQAFLSQGSLEGRLPSPGALRVISPSFLGSWSAPCTTALPSAICRVSASFFAVSTTLAHRNEPCVQLS